MRCRVALVVLSLVLSCASAFGGEFRLHEISHIFDSKGFESEVEFWANVFGRWGGTEIVYHDRRDLRLVYEVISVDRVPGDDKEEWKRQNEILERRADQIRDAIKALGRGEASPEAESIARRLKELGYSVTPDLCEELAGNIRFQRGVRDKFREGLLRSGKYLDEIEDIFRREGLPIELALLPHVESSFDYSVRSKAGAAGMWQFVRSTGRLYLKINRSFDERLDPIRSTEAAARLLKENYESLGSWPLAVVAYNHGRYGMMRARQAHGADLRKITREYQSRTFGFASRNFYPEFLAAVLVARNSEDYFGPLQPMPPVKYENVVLTRMTPVSRLLSAAKLPLDVLKDYNPHFTQWTWSRSLPAGLSVRVPAGSRQALAELTRPSLGAGKAERAAASESGSYRVRSGDTLQSISRKFAVPVASLVASNRLRDRDLIHPGQVLTIPGAEASTQAAVQYRVRKGDTLDSIARRFRVSLSSLTRVNDIVDPHRILLGQVLLIPTAD